MDCPGCGNELRESAPDDVEVSCNDCGESLRAPRTATEQLQGTDQRLLEAVDEFEREGGGWAQLDAFLARHPDDAEQLRAVLEPWLRLAEDAGGPSPDPVRLGHYEIVRELGRGGMGRVFLARDDRLGREVALKVLPPDPARGDARRLRFEREARALAAVAHPNIVAIHDVGHEGSIHFIAMELMERSLSTREAAEDPAAIRHVVEQVRQAAAGLAVLHEQGIVHRDIKPSNLLVAADGRVCVADLGLARIGEDPGLTVTGHGMGTALFSAPEQLRGEEATTRSDVFGLAASLHFLLIGAPPSLTSEVPASVPAGLRGVLSRALLPDPARRTESIAAFSQELSDWLEGRWRRRRLLRLGSGGAVLAGLVVLITALAQHASAPLPERALSRMVSKAVYEGVYEVGPTDGWFSSLKSRGHSFAQLGAMPVAKGEATLRIGGHLVTARLDEGEPVATVTFRSGRRTLSVAELAFPPTGEHWELLAGPIDVDGDGFDDALVRSATALTAIKFAPELLGDPSLGWRFDMANLLGQSSVTVHDWDADGRVDVLLADSGVDRLTGRQGRPVLHQLGLSDGLELDRWELPVDEPVHATPQLELEPETGRVSALHLVASGVDAGARPQLYRIRPAERRLERLPLPRAIASLVVGPALEDVNGDGVAELVVGAADGWFGCLPRGDESRPLWAITNRLKITSAPVLSQQDGDDLLEACFGCSFLGEDGASMRTAIDCVNLEPELPAAERLVWRHETEESFLNAAVEIPDLDGDGLGEIASGNTDGSVYVVSRRSGLLHRLTPPVSPVSTPQPASIVARLAVLPGGAPGHVRVVAMNLRGRVLCWRVSVRRSELEWEFFSAFREAVASPRVVRWDRERDGTFRLGLLVHAGPIHLLELQPDGSGPPRLVWSSWAPTGPYRPYAGACTPAFVEVDGEPWAVVATVEGRVHGMPIHAAPYEACRFDPGG